ncbi:hypothetical protein FRC11_005238 [Ceratobasidium sp. 423]|nr:hypothetical protein FRC11_005238 [Ceratobasidium sp. 423]
MGEEELQDEGFKACVTVPEEMVNDRHRRFRCPECLSETPSSLPDAAARSLLEQVSSALCVFEVEFVSYLRVIGDPVDVEEVTSIHSQLVLEGPYHLALVFMTEGDPRGGWWITSQKSKGGAGQTNEKKFLRYHTKELTKLATDAATSRIFILSCSTNMFKPSTLGAVHGTMNRRPWHSVVIPTTASLLVNEMIDILPELFIHLYYFGANFKSSLLRIWAKSISARVHTGFIIMDRQGFSDELSVSKIEYAAQSIRPYGVHLPVPESLCGCWGKVADWKLRHVSSDFGESFHFLRSSCCAHELHVAIFTDRRTVRKLHGITIMQEDWDESTQNFTFDPSIMVRMVQSPARRGTDVEAQRPRHEAPWTLAGRQAQEQVASSMEGSMA